jgi:hypothetical protein
MNDYMPRIEIAVTATLEDIDSFLELVGSQTERIYLAAAGLTTVGAIEIAEARLTSEGS